MHDEYTPPTHAPYVFCSRNRKLSKNSQGPHIILRKKKNANAVNAKKERKACGMTTNNFVDRARKGDREGTERRKSALAMNYSLHKIIALVDIDACYNFKGGGAQQKSKVLGDRQRS